MVSSLTAAPINKDDLNQASDTFGYAEKVPTGALDVVDTWTETTGGTGAESIVNGKIRLDTGVNNGSICAIGSNMGISNGIIGEDSNFPYTKKILEFQMALVSVANIDNSTFFVGFADTNTSNRATDNVVGFALSSDDLLALSDDAGTEETTDLSGSFTLTDKNLFKIVWREDSVQFYVNGSLVATHTTRLGVPVYVMFYLKNDAAASGKCDLRAIKWWCE